MKSNTPSGIEGVFFLHLPNLGKFGETEDFCEAASALHLPLPGSYLHLDHSIGKVVFRHERQVGIGIECLRSQSAFTLPDAFC